MLSSTTMIPHHLHAFPIPHQQCNLISELPLWKSTRPHFTSTTSQLFDIAPTLGLQWCILTTSLGKYANASAIITKPFGRDFRLQSMTLWSNFWHWCGIGSSGIMVEVAKRLTPTFILIATKLVTPIITFWQGWVLRVILFVCQLSC